MTQVARNTTTGIIEMLGNGLGERTGCAIEDITDNVLAAIRSALAQPNGGVTLSSDHATIAALPVPGPTQAEQDSATTRTAVQAQLAGIVGLSWTSLTAAQRQSLIVALLFKAGALDKTLTVQPLTNWL